MSKRLIALLLIFCFAFSLCSLSAMATDESTTQENNTQETTTQETTTQENTTQETTTQENNTQETTTQETTTQENNTQETTTQETTTQENTTQENNTQENNTQENNTQENNTQENNEKSDEESDDKTASKDTAKSLKLTNTSPKSTVGITVSLQFPTGSALNAISSPKPGSFTATLTKSDASTPAATFTLSQANSWNSTVLGLEAGEYTVAITGGTVDGYTVKLPDSVTTNGTSVILNASYTPVTPPATTTFTLTLSNSSASILYKTPLPSAVTATLTPTTGGTPINATASLSSGTATFNFTGVEKKTYSLTFSGLALDGFKHTTTLPGTFAFDPNNVPVSYSGTVTYTRSVVPTLAEVGTDVRYYGSGKTLQFWCNEPIAAVYVDGAWLDTSKCIIIEDGHMLSLRSPYLDTLKGGTHTVSVRTVYNTWAYDSMYLRALPTSSSPRTGDDSHIGLWAAVLLVSGAGMVAVIPKLKKQK